MVIDTEAKHYTRAEAEELLNYLYRYYHDRPRGEGEAAALVTRIQEWGFAGFLEAVETILNSDEMAEKVRREFNEVWDTFFSHQPGHSTRAYWETRLRLGRTAAKEAFEKECADRKAVLAQALALIDHDHDHLEAQRVIEGAIATGIADWFFYHHLGRSLHRQGRCVDAMQPYSEAIDRCPDDDWPWSCNDLKDCYEHSGLPDRFERGLEYFKTVVERFPNRWVGYHECGWMCWKLGRQNEAIPYYQQALSHRTSDPKHLPSWGWTANDLDMVYREQGQSGAAYEYFSNISTQHPGDWAVWYARASIERNHLGDTDLAVKSYERAVESLAPTWVLKEFGWYLRDLQLPDRSLQIFSKATSRDANDWEAWHGAGWILKSRGDWLGAKQHFEEALRCNPRSEWSWFELGFVYQNMASNPLNQIYAWEAYETTLNVGASNETACADARKGQAQLEEDGAPGASLLSFVERRYSLTELHDLCFKLGIDFDNVPGDTKSSRIVQLIKYCQRRAGKTLALIQKLHDERPDEFPPLVTLPGSSR